MTTTMNLTTQDYWTATATATAGFVAIHDASAGAPCDEVTALTSSKWDEHKFGLCFKCDCGLDDESDFVLTSNANGDDTVLMCYTCYGGVSAQRRRELRSINQ
jgi:hypothetical protein